jgi:hypothetical protein
MTRLEALLRMVAATIVAVMLGGSRVLAQAPVPPPVTGGEPASPGSGLAVIGLIVLLLVILGAAVRFHDLRRRREEAAMGLQARISDALLVEPALAGLPVTPTVSVPLLKRTPVKIDVAGTVPSPELRDHALRLVERVAAEAGREVLIEDRLLVSPTMARHAA